MISRGICVNPQCLIVVFPGLTHLYFDKMYKIMLFRSLPFDVIQLMVFCWDVPVCIVEVCRVTLTLTNEP